MASVSKLNGRSTSVAGSSFITSTNTSSARGGGAAREQRRVHAQQRAHRAGAEAARRGIHVGRDPRERRLDAVPGDGEVADEVGVDQRDDRAGEQQPGAHAEFALQEFARARRPTAPTGSSTPTASTEPGTA